MFECDVAVFGGGPGGYVAAIRALNSGKVYAWLKKTKLGDMLEQRLYSY